MERSYLDSNRSCLGASWIALCLNSLGLGDVWTDSTTQGARAQALGRVQQRRRREQRLRAPFFFGRKKEPTTRIDLIRSARSCRALDVLGRRIRRDYGGVVASAEPSTSNEVAECLHPTPSDQLKL